MSYCTTACRQPVREHCHCTGCHRTFRNLTGFEAHWTGKGDERHCVNPATLGLVEQGRLWATPEGHADAQARAVRLADSRARVRTQAAERVAG